jgi:hypothetical protein
MKEKTEMEKFRGVYREFRGYVEESLGGYRRISI